MSRDTPGQRNRGKTWHWLVLAIAMTILLFRGAIGGSRLADDFALVYVSARAWLVGANPYDGADADRVWEGASGDVRLLPSKRGAHDLLYPPMTFPVLAPVAVLPWPVAKLAWIAVNLAAFSIGIWMLARWAGLRTWSSWWVIFVAGAMLFWPVHTTLRMGQTSLVVLALLASAHALRLRGHHRWSGVLLGLCALVKPQFGVPFLAYEVFRRRWAAVTFALIIILLVGTAAVFRLHLAEIDWLASLRDNLAFFTTSGEGNASLDNANRYQMLNLHVVLHAFSDDPVVVKRAVWLTVALIAAVAFGGWLRRGDDEREIKALALGCTMCLLVVYHRSYDGVVLLVPAAWGVACLAKRGVDAGLTRWPTLIVLALVVGVGVPGSATLFVLARQGTIPGTLADSVAFRAGFVVYQAWFVLLIALCLTWVMWTDRDKLNCPPGPSTNGDPRSDGARGT